MHMSMKHIVAIFCIFCLFLPISAIADSTENKDELPLENAEDLTNDLIEDAASRTGPTEIDLRFAEILKTRAVPAIFATGAAFETAFYYGNSAALSTVSRERSQELQQAAALLRTANISDTYEPIRTEFFSKLDTLLHQVSAGAKLKQGCGNCVADIKRMKEYSQSFGIWTVDAISRIS